MKAAGKIEKSFVRDSFSAAEGYQSPLRDKRGKKIIHFLHEHIWRPPESPWLDVGCADGRSLALAASLGLVAPTGHKAVDLTEEMIAKARSRYPHLAKWTVADFFDLPLEDASIAGVLSNSSLGWAALENGMSDVFKEIRRVMEKGAPLGLVLPGPALPSEFLDSYLRAYRDLPAWHQSGREILNPLAGPSLEEMIPSLEEDFLLLLAETRYEAFVYESADQYLGELESSTRGVLLSPFQKIQEEEAWLEIAEEFRQNNPGPYMQETLATYIVARAL